MKVTKLEHACLLIEIDDAKLVVDPGSFTLPLVEPTGVVGVVITHEHPDHWTPEHLRRILAASPDARLLGPAGVVTAAEGFPVRAVTDGETVELGPFRLRFAGERHAVIHESVPVIDNVGVLINETLFYPGDAFTVPPFPVDTLAAPAGGPWLKIGDAMDYVTAVAPSRAFGTHTMTLSRAGVDMATDRLTTMVEAVGGDYRPLEPGESIDL
jgi:L-ascorbate metabolism protein UlaG (beta-lactamase superfamily)